MSLESLYRVEEIQERYFFHIPYAHIISDYVWPGLIMSPKRIEDLRHEKFGEDDVLIASYPKSGTTWMTEIISALHYGGDTQALRKVRQDERVPWLELEQNYFWVKAFYEYHKHQKGKSRNPRRVMFTHLPLELLPESVLYGKCKVVCVARNPKDNAVSFFYFHKMARFLGLQRHLSWDDWFALYMSGSIYCGSWFEHVKGYWEFSKRQPDRVLFCKFEDMKHNLPKAINEIASFVNMNLPCEQMAKVVDHCTFSSMKNNPMANRASKMLLDQTKVKFMRKGEIGDWKNYFTIAQSQFFDEVYEREMKDSGLDFEFE